MVKLEAPSQSNDHVLAEYCEMLKMLRLVPRLVSVFSGAVYLT